jgi:hypothetical protein
MNRPFAASVFDGGHGGPAGSGAHADRRGRQTVFLIGDGGRPSGSTLLLRQEVVRKLMPSTLRLLKLVPRTTGRQACVSNVTTPPSFLIPMGTTSKLSVTSLSDGRRVLLDLMLWVVAIMDDGEP